MKSGFNEICLPQQHKLLKKLSAVNVEKNITKTNENNNINCNLKFISKEKKKIATPCYRDAYK